MCVNFFFFFLPTRRAIPRWHVKLAEDGRCGSPGRQLHLPLGGQARVCPHGRWCQLSDLGLPLSLGRTQGHRRRADWATAHMQERQEDFVLFLPFSEEIFIFMSLGRSAGTFTENPQTSRTKRSCWATSRLHSFHHISINKMSVKCTYSASLLRKKTNVFVHSGLSCHSQHFLACLQHHSTRGKNQIM